MILSVPHECKLIERQVAWTSAWLRHWICGKNRPPSRFDNGPEFNSPKFSKKAINCLFHIGRLTLLSWFHALPLYSASQASVVTKCIEQYPERRNSLSLPTRARFRIYHLEARVQNISSLANMAVVQNDGRNHVKLGICFSRISKQAPFVSLSFSTCKYQSTGTKDSWNFTWTWQVLCSFRLLHLSKALFN